MVAILSVKYFENKLHNVSNVDKSGSTLGLYRCSIELMDFHKCVDMRSYDCTCEIVLYNGTDLANPLTISLNMCCREYEVSVKKSDFSKEAVSPVTLSHIFSGDVGISKHRYDHSSLKTYSLPTLRGLAYDIHAVLNSVYKH